MVAPFIAWESGHSAKQARRRPPNEPDVTVALNPPRDAIAVRTNLPPAPDRKVPRIAALEGNTFLAERTGAAAGSVGSTDRRAEVHKRLHDLARPFVLHHSEHLPLDLATRG